ncbi:MAG: polysaccharide biosynthesis tyrosine autokinase [Deltaproteobacteria bacterium]|nr:polysaccharide biosynthesis tyrosine autokinase [Deltaproteobacteria bacterium]
MELRGYFSLLLRWWWLLFFCIAFSGGFAYLRSSMQEPVFQAVSTVLISEASGAKGVDLASLQVSERLARTYVQLLQSEAILSEVVARLKCPFNAQALVWMLQVQLVKDTQLIRLSVDDTDPVRAAALCNLIPEVFIAYNNSTQSSRFVESKKSLAKEIAALDKQIEQMESQIATLFGNNDPSALNKRSSLESDLVRLRQSRSSLVQSYESQRLVEAQILNNVIVVDRASVPLFPVRPRIARSVVLGVIFGLLLGVALIFIIDYLDDSIKNAEQITTGLQLPLIGVAVLLSSKEAEDKPIAHKKPRAPITEAFRFLRSNILYAGIERPMRRILVTSINAQEGKSFVAANLATVFAQAGKTVALLDCDMHRPSLHKHFDKSNRHGLSALLLQETINFENVLRPTDAPNLSLLNAGNLPPNPAELLGSNKMGQLLDFIAETSDIILLDSPPIAAMTDASMLAHRVDGVVLVVEVGKTRFADLLHAKEQLERAGAYIIGVVFNKAPRDRSTYYHYHYSSYYYNSKYNEENNFQPGLLKNPVAYMQCLVKKQFNRMFVKEKEKKTLPSV